MMEKKEISTKELAEIISQAIIDEPYFNKETFIPKIQILIKTFRLKVASDNYSKILNPNQTEKLIRSTEIMNLENYFWKEQILELVGYDTLKTVYYPKLDEFRKNNSINSVT